MELVTFWWTLIEYARELAAAEKTGNKELIKEAKEKHDHYRDMCLKADRMIIGN